MEKALKYELESHISALNGAVYPTNAPEGADGPYLVYARIYTDSVKTLQGFTGKQALSYMFSVMAKRYESMKTVRDQVEALLKTFPRATIGQVPGIYVENLNINNVNEQYEHALGVNRGIIDFTIYI